MVRNCFTTLTDCLRDPVIEPSPNTMRPSLGLAPPDNIHFPVGVQLAHKDLGDRTAVKNTACSSPVFVRGIMHRPVNARSFLAHVQYDASAAAIAAVVGAPEQDVENLWLAGVRTPAKLTVDRRALASKDVCMRFTPQSVLDCSIISEEPHAAPASHTEEACEETGLDRGQFAELFHEDTKLDEECLEFGNALIGKLEALAGTSRAFPRYSPPTMRRAMRSHILPSNSKETIYSQVEGSDRPNAEAGRTCGFSKKDSHADLDVRCDGFAICKVGNGLYRTARGISEIEPPSSEDFVSFYFEVVIVDDKDSGGICIGVATDSLPLNKLVGSNAESCGLHSSGQIVKNNGEFREFGRSFKKGDRVGCMVTLSAGTPREDPRSPLPSQNGSYSESSDGVVELMKERDGEVELTFYINGEHQGSLREALWDGIPEDKRKLFPVVSLYKKDSKTVMQCCSKDWATKPDGIDNKVKAICCKC